MKKINILFIIFAALAISIEIYFIVESALIIFSRQYDLTLFIFFFLVLALLGLQIVLLTIKVINSEKNIQILRYRNIKYSLFTENFFIKELQRRKVKSGFIVAFSLEKSNANLLSSTKTNYLEDVTKSISKNLCDCFNDETTIYALNDFGAFLLYYPNSDFEELNTKLIDFVGNINQDNADNYLNMRIDLSFGCFDLSKYNVPIQTAVTKANLARNMIGVTFTTSTLLYSESIEEETSSNVLLLEEIKQGLINEEFEVYYQAKYDIKNERYIGAEALIRWNHPKKGLLFPGSFLPYAERTNVIVDIDRYVFTHVLKDIAKWKENGNRLVKISVNLSSKTLYQKDITLFIKSELEKYHVSPLLVEIELTESATGNNMFYALSIVKKIKELKLSVAMDDFGTGYSSLSNLRKFPFDTLKIDKSFFDDLEVNKKTRDVAENIISLAKALDMKVVAEGVETSKQVALLKSMDCDYVQGNYYSRAINAEEFIKLVKTNKKAGEQL